MVFPEAGVVLLAVEVDDVVVCAVPPLVEPVLGVDEVVLDAVLLVVVAAEVAEVVLDVVSVVLVDPVTPVEPAVPLVPVGPRLSSGLVIVGVIVGELVGTSSEIWAPPQAASARPHTETAPTSRALIRAAASFDGRRSGSR